MPNPREPFARRWRETRNRILQNPRFYGLAMGSVIGRFFARRSAQKLFDLTAGFIYSQILAAGVQAGLYERIANGPMAPEDIATAIDLPLDATSRLVSGSAALGLLDKLPDGRFMLGAQGAALLANPGVGAMVRHHDALYADLADPLKTLQKRGGGELAKLWDYGSDQSGQTRDKATDETARYTALMAASQDLVASETLRVFDIAPYRRILDIGGGNGRFLTHVAGKNRTAELHLFDRPTVAALARETLDKRSDASRFSTHGGNFLTTDFPVGCDLITLVRILHDHDDDVVEALLRRVYATLKPSRGTLLITEPMADERARSRIGDAYFNIYLHAMGTGRPRTPTELTEMLEAIGFRGVRRLAVGFPIATSALSAETH